MMIQPLQYFELSNIPMFYGTYLITEVSHNIKPHHIETNFTGVRQPIATVPVVEDVAIAMNQTLKNIEAKTGRNNTLDITTFDDCDVFGDSDISFGSKNVNEKGCAIAQGLVTDLGLKLEQACGVVGSLIAESGLRPAVLQCDKSVCPDGTIIESGGWTGDKFTQEGSLGYGWAQWTFYSFKNDFIKHAKTKGVDLKTTNATDELNFTFLKEWLLNHSNGNTLNELKKAKTVEEAAITFAVKYEGCKNCQPQSDEVKRRVKNGLKVYGVCQGIPVADLTQSSGSGKSWRAGSSQNKKCPEGFIDAGVKDGYNDGKRYRIKLCRLKEEYRKWENGSGGSGIYGRPINVDIAENTLKMLKAANDVGVPLKLGSTYRTLQEQIELGKKNGCPSNWTSSSQCTTPTAPAGKSNHQMGVAVDFACGKTGTICYPQNTDTAKNSCNNNGKECLTWLLDNAHKYGFYNYEAEAWHWSINGN
jgi:hypothetical protein